MLLVSEGYWRRDFWLRLLDLRDRHSKYREAIGHFESKWKNATRGEQRHLKQTFEAAWGALQAKEVDKQEKRISHVAWRAVTTGGKALGDELVKLDRFDQLIARASGLVTLWRDMECIAGTGRGREIISKQCVDVATIAQWRQVLKELMGANSAAGLAGGQNMQES
jgi:hypothetical protein